MWEECWDVECTELQLKSGIEVVIFVKPSFFQHF